MNSSPRPSWIIHWIALSISIGAPLLSQAATIDWKSDATTTAWATGSNWIGGVAPANDLTTDIASFNQTSYAFQPGATSNRQVAGLIFGNSTAAVTITTVNNQSRLSLGGSGVLMEETSGTVTIGAASNQGVNLGANQTWTNNSASLLTVDRVDNLTTTTPYTLTIGGSGSGGVQIRVLGNNNNTPGSPGSVALTINSTGSGVTNLTAANTFTGDTTLTSGTLRLGNASSLSNSALDTTGSGTLQLSGTTALNLGGLKGGRDLASVITSNYTTVTGLTLAVFSETSSYSGVISNGAATTGLTKAGNGTQILEGANTYSGITTINAGVVAVTSLGNG